MSGADLSGKVVLLTGVAGNLGAAAAEAFYAAGARCALVDRGLRRLQGLYPASDARRLLLAADLLDEASVARAVDAAAAAFGRIDIVCNIAGGFTAGTPVHETPAATWDAMFDLNAMSVVHVAKAVVPRMIAAGGGNIVNVAAASAVHGAPNMAAYVVSKSAVVRITESMAAELRPHGIAVCCVMPTTIDTPQNRAAMPGADTTMWTPAAAIAEVMLFLASDAAMIVSGCAIPIFGRPRR
jgi:NAD(P)-dependent dehydrogenase (short-subunit alcohol dehydrogenase family)